ncbi:MAG: hypothetical protein PHT78_08935 [Desulfitobacteriaceae bacterium]|nr:hypothetical protein [Desulfitobacteriaceae bacterium]
MLTLPILTGWNLISETANCIWPLVRQVELYCSAATARAAVGPFKTYRELSTAVGQITVRKASGPDYHILLLFLFAIVDLFPAFRPKNVKVERISFNN